MGGEAAEAQALGEDERTSIARLTVSQVPEEPYPPIEEEEEVPSQALSLDDADIEELIPEEVIESSATISAQAHRRAVMEAPPLMAQAAGTAHVSPARSRAVRSRRRSSPARSTSKRRSSSTRGNTRSSSRSIASASA